VIINKHDLHAGQSQRIEELSQEYGAPVIGRVPFDRSVNDALLAHRSVIEHGLGPVSIAVRSAWSRIIKEFDLAQENEMRVAVTALGRTLEDHVDRRFGRCRYFVIVEPNSLSVEDLDNDGDASGGGAGVRAAQILVDHGVDAVITGDCGPNAFRALKAAGISVYTGADGTVSESIQRYVAGELSEEAEPTTESHSGTQQRRKS
jgi:predicted Fe-Mo cluster-binding NifX family protein